MPYTKQSDDPLERLLNSRKLNSLALAKVLGCTPPTAMGKLRDTEKLTVGDLRKINRYAHIPIEEIRAALKWKE